MASETRYNTIPLGNLLSVADQIQAFANSRKTGEIAVTSVDGIARINLVDGDVVDAQFGDKEGVDAAVSLINLRNALTEFRIDQRSEKRTIHMAYVQLLCEAARIKDELEMLGPSPQELTTNGAPPAAVAEQETIPLLRIELPNEVRTYEMRPGTYHVGRHSMNEIVIPEPTVSQHHAEIECVAHGTILRDLGSLNGTYVEKQQIRECWLRPNDRIQFGGIAAIYLAGGGP